MRIEPVTAWLRTTLGKLPTGLGPYGAMWITLLIGGAFVVALAAVAAEVYESVAADNGVAGVDRPLLSWMIGLRTPELSSATTMFTHVGGTIGMPALAVVVIAVLSRVSRSWRPLILVGITALGSLAMTVVGKNVIGRARPDLADAVPPYEASPSFPSGHTLNATAIIAVIAYLCCLEIDSTLGRVAVILGCSLFVVLMGISRVFLGHHWFTDVAAAWALGLAWSALVVLAHRVFRTVRSVRRERGLPASGAEPR
ncbi:phosphatase PAP2 family protein [Arthrobacter sp. KK5.5]|uniref:phosphatase PAP2 family protein n=1 Tax=Arthrobacter sp. KK5.5 TaxID=3373084 RepID=UPI003EE6C3A7